MLGYKSCAQQFCMITETFCGVATVMQHLSHRYFTKWQPKPTSPIFTWNEKKQRQWFQKKKRNRFEIDLFCGHTLPKWSFDKVACARQANMFIKSGFCRALHHTTFTPVAGITVNVMHYYTILQTSCASTTRKKRTCLSENQKWYRKTEVMPKWQQSGKNSKKTNNCMEET